MRNAALIIEHPGINALPDYIRTLVETHKPAGYDYLRLPRNIMLYEAIAHYNIRRCFDLLKSRVRYVNDPPDYEYIQSFPTFLDNGLQGDCDCFTVFVLTLFAAYNQRIMNEDYEYSLSFNIVGRRPGKFTHIYPCIDGIKFDLTRSEINQPPTTEYLYYMTTRL